MKKLLSLLFVLGLTLSACGTSQTQSAPPVQTSTLASTSTSTITSTATQTPIPPTATVTPLPTIPTFTPTFDVSTIVTVTPAEKAVCQISPDEYSHSLVNELSSFKDPIIVDLTNDGVSEIIIDGNRNIQLDGDGSMNIFGCQDGSFIELEHIQSFTFPLPWVSTIQDLNQNGIPEVVIVHNECMFSRCKIINVFEWNGSSFVDIARDPLLPFPLLKTEALDDLIFEDIDGNGTVEIVMSEGLPLHPDSLSHGPLRKYTSTFSWNGEFFTITNVEKSTPEYRFQAIQDADKKSRNQEFSKALELYREAISNDNLIGWSPEAAENYREWVFSPNRVQPSPIPFPPDPSEYPRLAAYAYFRIMLLHLVQGQETEAASTYQTLQETFGNDPYAAPYVEVASAFWEAYQSEKKMYDGCAAAIQYAVEHPEILVPLGSDYHGWQSHIYEPADVCPFR